MTSEFEEMLSKMSIPGFIGFVQMDCCKIIETTDEILINITCRHRKLFLNGLEQDILSNMTHSGSGSITLKSCNASCKDGCLSITSSKKVIFRSK